LVKIVSIWLHKYILHHTRQQFQVEKYVDFWHTIADYHKSLSVINSKLYDVSAKYKKG
jgi:hypothetical protein